MYNYPWEHRRVFWHRQKQEGSTAANYQLNERLFWAHLKRQNFHHCHLSVVKVSSKRVHWPQQIWNTYFHWRSSGKWAKRNHAKNTNKIQHKTSNKTRGNYSKAFWLCCWWFKEPSFKSRRNQRWKKWAFFDNGKCSFGFKGNSSCGQAGRLHWHSSSDLWVNWSPERAQAIIGESNTCSIKIPRALWEI